MTNILQDLPAILAVFIEVALKGTLLMAAAAAVAFTMRSATATLRHMLWTFALAAMLAIPALVVVLPRWQVGILPVALSPLPVAVGNPVSVGAESAAPADENPQAVDDMVAGSVVHDVPAVEAEAPTKLLRGNSLLFLWLGGIATGLITIIGGMLALRRIARRARPLQEPAWTGLIEELSAELGISRKVRLLRSEYAAMPATWGILSPVILLPAESAGWDDDRRRVVLLHELAHVKRNDCLTQLIAQLSCAVYWFHPGVWYTAHRVRAERELACDEHVLGAGVNACDYAAHLLEVARICRSPSAPAIAIAMARSSQLEGRLHAILDDRAGSRWRASRAARRATAITLAALTLPLAAMRPWPAAGDLPPDTFRWKGTVPSGKWVEVLTVYGDLRAEPSENDQLEIIAVRKSGDAASYRVAVEPNENGTRFCVVKASSTSSNSCRTAPGGALTNGVSGVRVDFLMKVPAGVGVSAHTSRGNIAADGMNSYVWGTSDQGDISIVTSDLAEASTRTGSISAEFGRRMWKQDLEFYTDKGDVTVVAPSDASMRIQMETGSGALRSEFPSRSSRVGNGQRSTASVGNGGGMLTLRTGRGTVELKRGGNAVANYSDMDFRYTDETNIAVDPKPNPNPDPDLDANPNPNPDPEYDPDPNINPHVPDDPTGERVPVTLPDGLVSRFNDAAMKGWKDRNQIARLRNIASDHVKEHEADLISERATWALTLVRDGEVVAPLLAALRDNDWRVRAYAAWALSETHDSRGTVPLTSALSDEHWRVRMHAASALQRLGDERSVEPLIRALSDDTWQVHISAIDALGRIGDHRALPALKRVAQADSRSFVREEAQNAIRRIE